MKNKKLFSKIEIYEGIVSLNCMDQRLIKRGELPFGQGIFDAIKGFFASNSSGDVKKDLTNLFINGAIRTVISGPLGFGVGLISTYFGFDFYEILKSIYKKFQSSVSAGIPVSSEEIHSAVTSEVEMQTKTADLNIQNIKTAGIMDIFSKGNKKSILSSIISFIFKSALSGAGLFVASGMAKKLILPQKEEKETVEPEQSAPDHTSTQTKFKLRAGYTDLLEPKPWVESVVNSDASIEAMLLNFAKEVYDGLNGMESKIVSSPAFQQVKESIVFGNHKAAGDNIIIIPKMYKSKKHIVDYFIDDVAK